MKNEDKQKYADRVQYFVGFFKTRIKKRSWYHDLSRFVPGDNFFDKVLRADEKSAPDKKDFYRKIVLPAYKTVLIVKTNAKVESGFRIESHITNIHEKEEHEYVLGYEWWIKIYNLASRENQFSEDNKIVLESKRKQLYFEVKKIQGLPRNPWEFFFI